MKVDCGTYWILKQSDSLKDAVIISEVTSYRIYFHPFKNTHTFDVVSLHIKSFLATYKPHKTLNILYNSNK